MSDLIVTVAAVLIAFVLGFFGFVVLILARGLVKAQDAVAEMSKEIRLTQAVRNDTGAGRIQSAESRGPSARVVNEIARLAAARKKLTEPSSTPSTGETVSGLFRRKMRNPDSQGEAVTNDSNTGPAPVQA